MNVNSKTSRAVSFFLGWVAISSSQFVKQDKKQKRKRKYYMHKMKCSNMCGHLVAMKSTVVYLLKKK